MQLPPLIFGTLIRRYKRFLADVALEDGRIITAHCPNTGRMTTCAEPGWRVALSASHHPNRKYPFTWELVHNGTCWIGIHTGRANEVAAEAVTNGTIPELAGYDEVLREQPFGDSRFDLLLKREAGRQAEDLCYVEVKNVTLLAEDGCCAFPDAVSERGRRHLQTLTEVVRAGHRAAMLFVVPRSDGATFRAAREIDPAYAQALDRAGGCGVEILVRRAAVTPEAIRLAEPLLRRRD